MSGANARPDSKPCLTSIRRVSCSSTKHGKDQHDRYTHERCRRGQHLRMGAPHGHWDTTTFIGALTLRGMIAPFVISGPINRVAFEAYDE